VRDKETLERIQSEFLDEIAERAERSCGGKPHHAFIAWYVEAEFGDVEWKFTDDSSDGGIDAVVFLPGQRPSVCLIQSKWTHRVGKSLLNRNAYNDFDALAVAFHSRDGVDELLERCRDDVRRIYRNARDRLDELRNWQVEKKAFRLITTHTRRPADESHLLSRGAYVYADEVLALYSQYRKTRMPSAPSITLRAERLLSYRDAKRREKAFLLNARVVDYRNYLDKVDVARLVARNIRYNLGGRVGRAIRKTYESAPHDFWYLHNGLTIICDGASVKRNALTIDNPSVVNGAQTLYAVASSAKQSPAAQVTTRVIVRGRSAKVDRDDDEWLQTVIRGVNTQNRVRADDFRSNEPEQLELQRLFREFRVFYERKRGEWKEYRNDPKYRGFDRLSMKTLGMLLTAAEHADGKGVVLAKRGVETVFGDDNYKSIFPRRSLIVRRFERIYLAYRVYRLVRDVAYRGAREFRKQRHGFWTTVWAVILGIESVPLFYSRASLSSIQRAFDLFESGGRGGAVGRRAVMRARKQVWAAWRKARGADIEKWTANNFFKSAYGHRQVKRLAAASLRRELKNVALMAASGVIRH
jgi:hypothetical protein